MFTAKQSNNLLFLPNVILTACVGSFGINCSGRCVDAFYGFGCLSRCNCTGDQICDHVVGCKKDKTKHDTGIIC